MSMALVIPSCSKRTSSSTGMEYKRDEFNPEARSVKQEVPYDLEYIPGSTFRAYTTNGTDTVAQQITVMDFFLARHEETNFQYRNYIIFLEKYNPTQVSAALPDSNIWRNILPADYFSNSMYSNFPVVGLSISQIEKYLQWKTDRLNEYLLVSNGLVRRSEVLKTPYSEQNYKNLQAGNLLLPRYRLPSFYEWYYARRMAYKMTNETEVSKDLSREIKKVRSIHSERYKMANFKIFTTDTWFLPVSKRSHADILLHEIASTEPNHMGICYNNIYYGEYMNDKTLKGRYVAGGVMQDSISDPRLIAYRFTSDTVPGLYSFRCSMILLAGR